MSVQFFEKALASLKKANKERKLKQAQAAGYSTVEAYQEFLEGNISTPTNVQAKPKVKKVLVKKDVPAVTPTIMVVDILDASISMGSLTHGNSKISKAVEGVNLGLKNLKESKEKVKYQYGFCSFSEPRKYQFALKELTQSTNILDFRMGDSTALYDAIGKTLNTLIKTKESNEEFKNSKILVNIYTDGAENTSREFTSTSIARLIKEAEEKGFTVTFIGTEVDVQRVQENIKIDASNTLAYDGSAQGLEKAMLTTSSARFSYVNSVLKGEEVTRGFYKTVNNKAK